MVLGKLQPWVAVMENVKGMLSAQYEDEPVFNDVMEALQNAGGRNRYRLLALAPATGSRSWTDGLEPKDFLIRAEEHGVPQRRHRVFVICIRADVAAALPEGMFPKLKPRAEQVALSDVVGEMPRLRSRLSRGDDGGAWQSAVEDAFGLVGQHLPEMSQTNERKFRRALKLALKSASGAPLPFRDLSTTGAAGVADSCPSSLREWFCDENLKRLPNNETRGHIREDIGRYLYAAAFARTFGRSPRAEDFPRSTAGGRGGRDGKTSDRTYDFRLGPTPGLPFEHRQGAGMRYAGSVGPCGPAVLLRSTDVPHHPPQRACGARWRVDRLRTAGRGRRMPKAPGAVVKTRAPPARRRERGLRLPVGTRAGVDLGLRVSRQGCRDV